MSTINLYLSIGVGGACGAMLRYFVFDMTLILLGKGFPYATLLVNVLGSFLMGMVYAAIVQEYSVLLPWRGLLSIGFLGAFTTFSTFAYENHVFLKSGDFTSFAFYSIASFIVGFLAVFAGMYVVKLI